MSRRRVDPRARRLTQPVVFSEEPEAVKQRAREQRARELLLQQREAEERERESIAQFEAAWDANESVAAQLVPPGTAVWPDAASEVDPLPALRDQYGQACLLNAVQTHVWRHRKSCFKRGCTSRFGFPQPPHLGPTALDSDGETLLRLRRKLGNEYVERSRFVS